MKRALTLSALCWLAALLASCNHKELCYDHEPHAERVEYKLELQFDCQWEYNEEGYMDWRANWRPEFGMEYEDLRPGEPEGVRIHIFDEDDRTETVRNLPTHGTSVRFNNEGYYSVLFYNNDTEYILFQEMESFHSATATTRGVSRSSYTGNSLLDRSGGEEVTVNPPDMLYGAYREGLYVERSTEVQTWNETLYPLVFTYLIRYEIAKGAERVALARGALAGMAKGVNLGTGRSSKEVATVMFDCDMIGAFGAQATVKSFGVPDYPNVSYSRGQSQYGLNLEVRLTDGTTQQFEFDVTDQVEKQPHGGVIIVSGIEISDEPVDNGGGGFNIGVDGWGDAVDVPLPI